MPKQQYDNELRGVIFLTKKDRDAHQNAPDYRGNVTVRGTEYALSAWMRESERGVKYFSLALTHPDDLERREERGNGRRRDYDDEPRRERRERPSRHDDDDDEDLPF